MDFTAIMSEGAEVTSMSVTRGTQKSVACCSHIGMAPGISYPPPSALLLHRSPSAIPTAASLSRYSRSPLLSSSTSLRASSRTSRSGSGPLRPKPSPSSLGGPLVFFFRGHRLGRATCCTRGSTHLSSIHAWSLFSTICAIFGISCSREREPTRERTLTSSR